MPQILPPARTLCLMIAALSLLGACGNYTGDWPQLGPTAQDARPVMDDTVDAGQAAAPVQPAASLADAAALEELTARLTQAAVGFADTQARAQTQRSAVSKAVDRAGSITGTNWSRAQLELSRLNQIDAELSELRDDVSGIAGDLAAMSARGMPADDLVSQTGTLINAITKTLKDIAETRLRARETLTT